MWSRNFTVFQNTDHFCDNLWLAVEPLERFLWIPNHYIHLWFCPSPRTSCDLSLFIIIPHLSSTTLTNTNDLSLMHFPWKQRNAHLLLHKINYIAWLYEAVIYQSEWAASCKQLSRWGSYITGLTSAWTLAFSKWTEMTGKKSWLITKWPWLFCWMSSVAGKWKQ